MNLNDLICKKAPEGVFEFGGFKVRLKHASRSELQRLGQACTVQRWEKGQRVAVLDDKKLATEFAHSVVVGWEDLTLEKASKLIPLDLSQITDKNTPVEFSRANLEALVVGNAEFDRYVQSTATDLAAFQPELSDELKNSEASQSGS